MRAMGVTCAEIKTGYGLDTRTELKQISVIDQLKKAQKMHIVGTFMGLHAVPRGMNADEYTDECIRESLPAAAGTGVCEFADAFVERGAFSAEQAKRYFLKAKQLGFSLKVHADEMTPSGGTRLGVELGAKSADHLLKILDEDIALLAKSQTVATVLPLTAFCLGEEYAPARRLIDGGAIVAAACAGIVCGKAEKQLEVISQVSEEQTQQLKQYLAQTPVSVRLADTPYIFDIDVRLGVDPRKANQMVRGVVTLPHGTGKTVRVLVLCTPEKEEEAKAAGADYVGLDEYVEKIKGGWTDVDVIITTPNVMGKVGALGRILGPRGLMPNPKTGTVTMDVAKAVSEVKAGKIDFKVDKFGIVHTSIGKVSFSPEQIVDNANEFLSMIMKLKPSAAKGSYVKSIYLSSTMSPGLQIDAKSVETK